MAHSTEDEGNTALISVIMPVYNGERFLEDAIANVTQQQYPALEIVVVDDGSSDRTQEIARAHKDVAACIRQTQSGPAAARNRGLQVARGDFIAFQDVDDLWPNDRLDKLLDSFRDDSIEIVLGRTQLMRLREIQGRSEFQNSGEPFITFHFGAALLRRSVFDRVGLLDETMRYSEDVDWFMRAREVGASMKVIDEVTLFYRLHQENTTHGKDLSQLNFLNALKKSLDRRRSDNQAAALLPNLVERPSDSD